jgi:uncharacterized SAM-binding protein YcdF (DUF218 family)
MLDEFKMKRTILIFFRPRQIWLPTFFGWLLLLVISLATCMFVALNIYSFLAQNEPVGARVLVVEGWLDPEGLEQAVVAFKRGRYERVVTTGGPIMGRPELLRYGTYARFAADYLAQHGIPHNVITAAPAPPSAQDRTFLSAVVLRDFARQQGLNLHAIDVFSSGTHARRSRLLFQMALGSEIRVGVFAAHPIGGYGQYYPPENWWRSSSAAESIVMQSIGLIWVKCCFWPGPAGSKDELWGTR